MGFYERNVCDDLVSEQSQAYLAYDSDTMRKMMKFDWTDLGEFRPLPRGPYKSIWRVLHVDGFEDGHTLQFYIPMKYEWSYSVEPPRVSDEHIA